MSAEDQPGRRKLLEAAAVACGAGAAALAVWPLGAAVIDDGSAEAVEAPWLDVAAEAELREGEPIKAAAVGPAHDGWTTAQREVGAVWLERRGAAVRAFSAACPHLGCLVHKEAQGGFACVCHDSHFSAEGKALSGPAPRGLDALPVRLDGGRVLVQLVTRPARKAG
jgi:Rieske Fe-S protein